MLNRNKKYIICVLSLLCSAAVLAGCKDKKSDIVSDNLIDDAEGFGTDTAKIGELKQEKSYSATVYYPDSSVICSPYNGVVMQKIEVEAGDKVKKGQIIVSIKQITDETIASQQEAIEKNLAELNKGIDNYNSQIASLDASIASSGGLEQQIYQVQKEKTQRQLDYYKEDGDKVQQDMKDELEVLKTLTGDINIYAPYDGVIDKVENVPEGTELTTTRELVTMHSEEETFVYVSDASSLKYNMPVTVETGLGDNRVTYTGRVISADNVLDDAYQTGAAYIKLDEKVSPDDLKNITVMADVKKLENVLLVKDYAVTTQNDQTYITIVDGDKLKKRPVIVGADDGKYIWIVKGLEEGQKVLIQ